MSQPRDFHTIDVLLFFNSIENGSPSSYRVHEERITALCHSLFAESAGGICFSLPIMVRGRGDLNESHQDDAGVNMEVAEQAILESLLRKKNDKEGAYVLSLLICLQR